MIKQSAPSLPGGLLSVFLTALSAAVCVYLVSLTYQVSHPDLLYWASICALGLAVGLSSRFLLSSWWLALQLLVSLLALFVGLVFLGFLSQGEFGIQFPITSADGLKSTAPGQSAAAVAAALVALCAWRNLNINFSLFSSRDNPKKAASNSQPSKTRNGRQKVVHAAQKTAAKTSSPKKKKSHPVTQRAYWEKRWKKLKQQVRHWWKHGFPDLHFLSDHQDTKPKNKKPAVRVQAKRPARKVPARQKVLTENIQTKEPQTNIHLIGKEEHRCPYCLEIVHPRDSRGVKICPICHTHHHADCWAVTGTCQVPHYHE